MTDESERWLRSLGRQSSVKDRLPHSQGKASESPKLSGVRRSRSLDSQDGSGSERLHHHTKSRTVNFSHRRRAAVLPAQVETTLRSTRPWMDPQVQQIQQPTPVHAASMPPAETQPSTTRPFIGRKLSTTQTSFRTTSTCVESSKPNPVVLRSKAHSSSHSEQQVHEARMESVTDPQAERRKPEEYRKQRDAARMEVKAQREQLAQSRAEVERGQKSCTGTETALVTTQLESSQLKRHLVQLNGEMNQLKEEIDQLREEKRQLEGRNSHLQAQVDTIQQRSKRRSKQILQLKQELGALKEENRTLEKSMDATKARNEEVEGIAQIRQAKLEEMTMKEEWARKQFESVTENSGNVCRRCHELEAEKRQLSEQMNKLSRLNDDSIALLNELMAQIRKQEQEKEGLQNEIQIARTEVQKFEQESEELQSRAVEWKARHDRIEVEVQRQREALERRIADLEIVKDQLQQESHEEQSQLKMERDNLQLANNSIQDEIEKLQEENKKLSMDVGALHQDKKSLEKSMEATKEVAVALRLQLAVQKSEQDQLHHQLDETEATVRQLEADLNFSRSRVAELEGESTEMKTALSEAEHDHQRIYQEKSKLIKEKEALLQLQLRQLTQEKDRFIQSLQSEKDQLRQQLSALSWQIQRYEKQPQSQRSHESNFWEVPRNEITLNMQKFLGTGAWGFVVEGKFRGQQVAVKCLHDMIHHPEVVETIRKEICIMAQIRHPNMVMLIAAVINAENGPLIVTELLDISLRKAYEKHRLQGSSKLSIFRDIASALNYLHLHQRGEIIHRDVSSANVLLEAKPNNQWKAKLSDFGSAKLAIEAKTTGPGAPAYTAPEVQREMGIRQTAKLDVYSYGILLCEVIVEEFPKDGSLASMVQTVRNRWSFMHSLVTSCIKEHPDNRPTMSYVLGEFDKLLPKE